jgi:hypothetical protein
LISYFIYYKISLWSPYPEVQNRKIILLAYIFIYVYLI